MQEVVTAAFKGKKAVITNDVEASDGRQVISIEPGIKARVFVLGQTAYFSGDQVALVHYFGLPVQTAQKIGARWIDVPASQGNEYKTVADDVTLSSALDGLKLSGHLTELAPSKIDGQTVVGIIGTATRDGGDGAAGAVYVTQSAHPMPVEATYTAANGAHSKIRFGRWGQRLTLPRPHRIVTPTALAALNSTAVAAAVTATKANSRVLGYWVATGTVLATSDSAAQVPGEVIERLWQVRQSCSGLSCHLELARQVAGATAATTLPTPLTAPLQPTHDGWLATFTENSVACKGASAIDAGTEVSHWTMSYTATRITALERTLTSGPNCETGTSTIRWTAVRAPSSSGVSS